MSVLLGHGRETKRLWEMFVQMSCRAAGKVRNTIRGGDFLFESKTTIKENPAVTEVFGESGEFFINASLDL